jgi:acyl-CoA thioesterase FadM
MKTRQMQNGGLPIGLAPSQPQPDLHLTAPDPARVSIQHYPLRYELPTRWSDVQHGQLSGLAVARLCEDARMLMMTEVLEPTVPLSSIRTVLRGLRIEYLLPLYYPEPVSAAIGILRLGVSSYTFAIGLFQREACCCLSDSTSVALAQDRRGTAPLPAPVRAILQQCMVHGTP